MTLLKKIHIEKKSHLKIPIELCVTQTMKKTTVLLSHPKKQLCFYCRILLLALHIALICSTTLPWSGAVT